MTLTIRYAEAVSYESIAHATQTRKGTDLPYICHLLGVSSLVLEAGGDEELAIAGLLHDVAEDQGGDRRLDDVRKRFGDRVADIVEACSDSLSEDPSKKAPYEERKRHHIEHLRHASDDVLLVTAADKLHNARAIHADLLVLGPGMLNDKGFNGTAEQILWYYYSILAVLEERQVSPHLTKSLRHTVDEMSGLL